MGKHDAPEFWAICHGCAHFANVTRVASVANLVCSACGSRSYSLSVNDPSKPFRSAQTNAGEIAATIRLPPPPEIDPEAWERGEFP